MSDSGEELRPDELAEALVDAWNQARLEDFEGLFERAMWLVEPDEVFGRALKMFDARGSVEFGAVLYDLAANVELDLIRPDDGAVITSETSLFAFVVQGPAESLSRFSRDPAMTRVTKQLKACGLIHPSSSALICTTGVDLTTLSMQDPSTVRDIAEAFAAGLATGEVSELGDYVAKVLGLKDDEVAPDVGNTAAVVTRLFLGARLIVRTSEDVMDTLDPPPLTGEPETDDDLLEARDGEIAELRSNFTEAAAKICEGSGVNALMTGPFEWTRSLGEASVAHLAMTIHMEAGLSGCDIITKRADEAHIGYLNDEIVVAMRQEGVLIGPVSVTLAAATYGLDQITDWLLGISKKLIRHDDGESILSLRQGAGISLQ